MTQVMFSSFVTVIVAGVSSQVCPSKSPHLPFSHLSEIPMCMVQHSLSDEGIFLSQSFLCELQFCKILHALIFTSQPTFDMFIQT